MTRAKKVRNNRAGDVTRKRASLVDIKNMKKKSACKRSCFCRLDLATLETDGSYESLRSKQILQDIVLLGNDSNEKMTAHKLILLNLGSKFQKLLCDVGGETGLRRTMRLNAPVAVVKELVRYAYSGKCNVNSSNLRHLMLAAKELEVSAIVKLGGDYLLSELRVENAFQSYLFAKRFLCADMRDKVKKFILQNFIQIAKQDKSFCPVQDVEEFLKDDELNIREEQLFEIVVDWAKRDQNWVELLKHVRFTLMNPDYFESKVETCPLIADKVVAKHVAQAKSFFLRLTRTRSSTLKLFPSRFGHKSRIPNEIVFAVGGWSAEPNGPTSCIETFDIRSYKWNTMKFSAPSPRAYHGLAMADKKIYLFGGYDGEEYFSAMTCYDPVAKTWENKAPMYHARCYVSSAVHEDKIYALGGFNGRTRLSSMECYDPKENLWTLLPSMRIVRSDASAVAYNGKIYVVGGFTGEEILDSVEVYDPVTKEWSFGPRLNTIRSGVKCVVYQSKIYVLGGFDGHHRLKSVECLDLMKPNEGWSYVSDLTTQRSNFSLTVVDDKILVMGGFEGSGVVNKTEVYSGQTNSWTPYPPMNMQRSAVSAVTLSGLPNSRYFVNRSVDSD